MDPLYSKSSSVSGCLSQIFTISSITAHTITAESEIKSLLLPSFELELLKRYEDPWSVSDIKSGDIIRVWFDVLNQPIQHKLLLCTFSTGDLDEDILKSFNIPDQIFHRFTEGRIKLKGLLTGGVPRFIVANKKIYRPDRNYSDFILNQEGFSEDYDKYLTLHSNNDELLEDFPQRISLIHELNDPNLLFSHKRCIKSAFDPFLAIGIAYLEHICRSSCPSSCLDTFIFNLESDSGLFQALPRHFKSRTSLITYLKMLLLSLKNGADLSEELNDYYKHSYFLQDYTTELRHILANSLFNHDIPKGYRVINRAPTQEIYYQQFSHILGIKIVLYDENYEEIKFQYNKNVVIYMRKDHENIEIFYLKYQIYPDTSIIICEKCKKPPHETEFSILASSVCKKCLNKTTKKSAACSHCLKKFKNAELKQVLGICNGNMCDKCIRQTVERGRCDKCIERTARCYICKKSCTIDQIGNRDMCKCVICKACERVIKAFGESNCPYCGDDERENKGKCSVCDGFYVKADIQKLSCEHLVCKICLVNLLSNKEATKICYICDTVINKNLQNLLLVSYYHALFDDALLECDICMEKLPKIRTNKGDCPHIFCDNCLSHQLSNDIHHCFICSSAFPTSFYKKLKTHKPNCSKCGMPNPELVTMPCGPSVCEECFKSYITHHHSLNPGKFSIPCILCTSILPKKLYIKYISTDPLPSKVACTKEEVKDEVIQLGCNHKFPINQLRQDFQIKINNGNFELKCLNGCVHNISNSKMNKILGVNYKVLYLSRAQLLQPISAPSNEETITLSCSHNFPVSNLGKLFQAMFLAGMSFRCPHWCLIEMSNNDLKKVLTNEVYENYIQSLPINTDVKDQKDTILLECNHLILANQLRTHLENSIDSSNWELRCPYGCANEISNIIINKVLTAEYYLKYTKRITEIHTEHTVQLPCKHKFNLSKLRADFQSKLDSGIFTLKCPRGCAHIIGKKSFKEILSPESFNNFLSKMFPQSESKAQPKLFNLSCPACQESYTNLPPLPSFRCSVCNLPFCSSCGKPSYLTLKLHEPHYPSCSL
jgi:hypothetical protein